VAAFDIVERLLEIRLARALDIGGRQLNDTDRVGDLLPRSIRLPHVPGLRAHALPARARFFSIRGEESIQTSVARAAEPAATAPIPDRTAARTVIDTHPRIGFAKSAPSIRTSSKASAMMMVVYRWRRGGPAAKIENSFFMPHSFAVSSI
jgi:hypothetical protein